MTQASAGLRATAPALACTSPGRAVTPASPHPPPSPSGDPPASAVAAVDGELWAWGLNVNTVFGVVGRSLSVATKLPVGHKVVQAQLGCQGAHWEKVTRTCHIWVLAGG